LNNTKKEKIKTSKNHPGLKIYPISAELLFIATLIILRGRHSGNPHYQPDNDRLVCNINLAFWYTYNYLGSVFRKFG